jgi:hypothetical protein
MCIPPSSGVVMKGIGSLRVTLPPEIYSRCTNIDPRKTLKSLEIKRGYGIPLSDRKIYLINPEIREIVSFCSGCCCILE